MLLSGGTLLWSYNKLDEVTVGGVNDVVSVEVSASSGAACATCSVVTLDSSFGVGDSITLTAALGADSGTIFTGYVDTVTLENPPGTYRIEGRDSLSLALDYLIVVASLDEADWFNPRNQYGHTAPLDIINDILELCGLDDASGSGDAGWELGNATDGTKFQLVLAWDAVQQICNIGAWKVWCDPLGDLHFGSVLDYGDNGGTFNVGGGGNIISASYSRSNEDLRNKIVAIGENGDYTATASAVSPYLPSGFYKTAVISTDLIGSQSAADASADDNLDALNRLTEVTTIEAEGSPNIWLYSPISVNEPFTGAPGGMVTSVTHRIDANGYRTSFTAKVVA